MKIIHHGLMKYPNEKKELPNIPAPIIDNWVKKGVKLI